MLTFGGTPRTLNRYENVVIDATNGTTLTPSRLGTTALDDLFLTFYLFDHNLVFVIHVGGTPIQVNHINQFTKS